MWQGPQLMAHLHGMGLPAEAVGPLWVAYQDARAEEEAMQQSRGAPGGVGPGPSPAGTGAEPGPGPNPAPAARPELAVRVGGKALGLISRLIQIAKLLHEVCWGRGVRGRRRRRGAEAPLHWGGPECVRARRGVGV